ncbi:hypothetical protein MMC06_003011 [Schaereria dolodes]|nr:hypothetical protein [Schaereria dolodes]
MGRLLDDFKLSFSGGSETSAQRAHRLLHESRKYWTEKDEKFFSNSEQRWRNHEDFDRSPWWGEQRDSWGRSLDWRDWYGEYKDGRNRLRSGLNVRGWERDGHRGWGRVRDWD